MRLTVEADGEGQRLDRYLAKQTPRVSRATIMKYLKEGRARRNGQRARPGLLLRAGDDLDLPGFAEDTKRIQEGKAAGLPDLPPARRRPPGIFILYEDAHLVVVDKPPGLVMHPGKGHREEGLDRILAGHFGPATRLVHRLDRDTSGVLVAARGHPSSARRLAEAFREGEVEKVYLALVRGVPEPEEGTIDAPLLDTKEVGSNVKVDPAGKPARTDYRTLRAYPGFALLELRPKSGRRHQIRAHLAHIGHPLAVDHVYGSPRKLRLRDLRPDLPVAWKNPVILGRMPLHAVSICFRHPETGEEVTFEAPIPPDMERALEVLAEGR